MIFENATESYDDHAKIAALDEVDGMFKKSHASLKVREHNTLKKRDDQGTLAWRICNGRISFTSM